MRFYFVTEVLKSFFLKICIHSSG